MTYAASEYLHGRNRNDDDHNDDLHDENDENDDDNGGGDDDYDDDGDVQLPDLLLQRLIYYNLFRPLPSMLPHLSSIHR